MPEDVGTAKPGKTIKKEDNFSFIRVVKHCRGDGAAVFACGAESKLRVEKSHVVSAKLKPRGIVSHFFSAFIVNVSGLLLGEKRKYCII